ncbi:uncharacterized protein LOC143026567 isoform X2 [Oratosquilla oratoria]|uniref:uncharacterized protein LOC143026567 isoform X2 n=1 Tax=Oratosquilla oratoria TaxID=337810 RepID=UPI003F76DBEB
MGELIMLSPRRTSWSLVLATLTVLALTKVSVPALADSVKCASVTDEENLDHPMPTFARTLQGSYSLRVEMTALHMNKTFYVNENRLRSTYHSSFSNVGTVSVTENGTETVFHYFPDTKTMIEESGGECKTIEFDLPPFNPWGWFDPTEEHGDVVYGPSAILRLAQFVNKRVLSNDDMDDGVLTDHWGACLEGGDVSVWYFMAEPPWQMAAENFFPDHEGEGRLPVEFQVFFMGTSEMWQYSIVEFLPFVSHPQLLETPRGLSCEGMVSVAPEVPRPSIPPHFHTKQELVFGSFIDGRVKEPQAVVAFEMTYSEELALVRMDYAPIAKDDTPFHTTNTLKVIHDFNTGVQYVIDKEQGNCTMGWLPEKFFDVTFHGIFGTGSTMVGPNQLFHLDSSYAFVGDRITRGIATELWTSTRSDIINPYTGSPLAKAVLEHYFIKEDDVEGERLSVPVRTDLFVYNDSDPTQVMYSETTNSYDFAEVPLLIPDEFKVEECYSWASEEWSNLFIIFSGKGNQKNAVAANPDLFSSELSSILIAKASLSPVRIASVDVSEGMTAPGRNQTATDMIIVSVRLLERAPYIFSYVEGQDEANQIPGSDEEKIENINIEECAELCSKQTKFACKSFHSCDKTNCFLSKVEGPEGPPLEGPTNCTHWRKADINATFDDTPSIEAAHNISDAIHKDKIKIVLPYGNKNVTIPAIDSLLLRSPDPLDAVRNQFNLDARHMTLTNPDDTKENVENLLDCEVLCVGHKSFRCETLAYEHDSHKCLLSATHYLSLNESSLAYASRSYVHGRSYLVDYSPVWGGVSINTTGPVYNSVDDPSACAMHCSTEASIDCKSFEWCIEEHVCRLHKEHYLDAVSSGLGGQSVITQSGCIHFSKKTDQGFSKHPKQGQPINAHHLAATSSDVASCAKLCLEDEGDVCESFDLCSVCTKQDNKVCGEDNIKLKNLCFLSTHHIGEEGFELLAAHNCDHYSREYFGDIDYAKWKGSQRTPDKPYGPGDMTGLAFGTLALGILISISFLFAIVKFQPAVMPKDFSISFVNIKGVSAGETRS